MFFIVKYIDQHEFETIQKENKPGSNQSLTGSNKILLVNPDCPIGIIRDYISNELLLAQDNIGTFELCTEKGILLKTSQVAPVVNGLDLLKEKETYYVVPTTNISNDSVGPKTIITPLLNLHSKEYCDFMMLQRRKSSSSKLKRSTSSKSSSREAISVGSVSTKATS